MAKKIASRDPLNTRPIAPLPITSYAKQYSRQHISDTWEPHGFDRFKSQQALLRDMSVLGGPADQGGGNPDRYLPISKVEEDFPVA